MTHRCRNYPIRPQFSLKGVPSVKLHRDLEITQKSAWHWMHRLRRTFETTGQILGGPCEADEAFIGGLVKNKDKDKKPNTGQGGVGKALVAGVKNHGTNQVAAKVLPNTSAKTLQGFVEGHTKATAQVYTDDRGGCVGTDRAHESVSIGAGEYVRDMAHTNGIESFWSMLGRGQKGTLHKFNGKHLQRYVCKFSERYTARNVDTLARMRGMGFGAIGKELTFDQLIADYRPALGARS